MSIMETLRRLSGRGANSADSESTPKAGAVNVWRGVFDPASNPNTKNVGRSYYDNPDPADTKTTWDMHLDAQKAASHDMTQASFKAMGAKSASDQLDTDQLRQMFTPDRVDRIMQVADKNKDGKISFSEFCSLIKSNECP